MIISRGELVQIGGGFRIGEILEATGAKLREVGATNKTTLADYARAINRQTAMILKVHRSNFFMSGFVESPSSTAIAELARQETVPVRGRFGKRRKLFIRNSGHRASTSRRLLKRSKMGPILFALAAINCLAVRKQESSLERNASSPR